MFTRIRSRTKMGSDMAQFRREIEDSVDKALKDYEKSVESQKGDEKVRQYNLKVQSNAQKIKLEMSKKCDSKSGEFDVVQVRKELDQLIYRISGELRKDLELLNESASDIRDKTIAFYDDITHKMCEKIQDFHVKDEAVKIRIDVERKLSDMANNLEKEYENVRDNSKDMIKQLKKVNENISKDIGRRLDDFKHDRQDVQRSISQMLRKISYEFEKAVNYGYDNDKVREVTQKVKNSTRDISIDISKRFDSLRHTLQSLNISDDVYSIRRKAEKTLANMSNDFKIKVRKIENGDVHVIDEFTKNFNVVSDKIEKDIHETLHTFNDDRVKAEQKVQELLSKFSADFQKQVQYLQGKDVMKDVQRTVEEVSKKASLEISSLVDGLKNKVSEFEYDRKTVKARREVEGLFANMQREVERDFQHLKDNQYVKESMEKLNYVQENIAERINEIITSAKAKGGQVESEMKSVIDKMNADYEQALHQVKHNPQVQEILKKVKNSSQKVSEEVSSILQSIPGNETVKSFIETARDTIDSIKENAYGAAHDAQSSLTDALGNFRVKANAVVEDVRKDAKGISDGVEKNFQRDPTPRISSLDGDEVNSRLEKILTSVKVIFAAAFWFFIFCIQSIPARMGDFVRLFRPKSLEGKIILITGTGNGLGRVLARKLVRLGAKVICVDVNTPANEETGDELRKKAKCHTCVRTYTCDISSPENCKNLARDVIEQYGHIDILINNAGIVASHKVTEGTDEAVKKVIEVNLISNFWMVRAFLPHMKERKRGHIVFINSLSGIHGLALASSYAASKAGLLGLAYSLQSELRADESLERIHVTSVHPLYFNSSVTSEHVNTRILTADYVADMTIHGIRRNLFAFTVPLVYGGFVFSSLIRLLPLRIYNYIMQQYGGINADVRPSFRLPLHEKAA